MCDLHCDQRYTHVRCVKSCVLKLSQLIIVIAAVWPIANQSYRDYMSFTSIASGFICVLCKHTTYMHLCCHGNGKQSVSDLSLLIRERVDRLDDYLDTFA